MNYQREAKSEGNPKQYNIPTVKNFRIPNKNEEKEKTTKIEASIKLDKNEREIQQNVRRTDGEAIHIIQQETKGKGRKVPILNLLIIIYTLYKLPSDLKFYRYRCICTLIKLNGVCTALVRQISTGGFLIFTFKLLNNNTHLIQRHKRGCRSTGGTYLYDLLQIDPVSFTAHYSE